MTESTCIFEKLFVSLKKVVWLVLIFLLFPQKNQFRPNFLKKYSAGRNAFEVMNRSLKIVG
jgi:hypothetical protein